MSDKTPLNGKTDALARQLKSSLAQRRPRPWKLVLASLAASVLLLGLLAWWMYPKPKPAPLQVMALDVVCTPEETPHVRAQLLRPPDEMQPRRLSGAQVVFREPLLPQPPGVEPRETIAKSDEHGQAKLEWPLRKPESIEFSVQHIDLEQQQASPHDVGRIFVWPKNTPLLMVDAEETLVAARLDDKASATLKSADKIGWRIVYLAPASAQPHDFRKVRRWLHENQAKLPIGPLLGRRQLDAEEGVADARRELLKQLQDRFVGPMFAVVKTPDAAEISKAAGLRTVLIGVGPAPAEVLRAPGWEDVPVKLK